MQHTKRKGADKGCECVGFQCHDPAGHEVPNDTMNKLVQSVRATGAIGVVGVFEPNDPRPADKLAGDGQIVFDMGLYFKKGLRMGSGQASVKRHNRELCDLIHLGRAKPSWTVSHHLHLHEAPDAYRHFDQRDDGWTKVIPKPT